jgi:hypothetical protein
MIGMYHQVIIVMEGKPASELIEEFSGEQCMENDGGKNPGYISFCILNFSMVYVT